MIKTIIFDNNGVLTTCDNDTTVPRLAKYFNVDEEYLRPIFHEVVKPADTGTISTEEFFRRLAATINKPCDVNEVWPIFKGCYVPKEGMQEFLKELSADYQIALLTNFVDYFDELNKNVWHYEKIFDSDKMFVSSKLHMAKPDLEIYEHVLGSLNNKPSETVFIDDREANLVPARALGMNTILFNSPEQLKNELKLLLEKQNGKG